MFLSIECSFKASFVRFWPWPHFEYFPSLETSQTNIFEAFHIYTNLHLPPLVAEDKPNGGKTLGIHLAEWMDISPAIECPQNTVNPYYLKAITKSDPNK